MKLEAVSLAMKRVLFLCTANSARSQMAEALTNVFRGDSWRAHSAGVAPGSQVHPKALAALQDLNISVTDLGPKSLDLFKDTEMDLIVTVCDRAAEQCPFWVRSGKAVHVPFADPSKVNPAAQRGAFRATRDLIRRDLIERLDHLLDAA